MPTGYTAPLEDGPMTFQQFAMRCARAFGALIDMREEPMDAPIPESFKPHSYASEKITKARNGLAELAAMSDSAAEAMQAIEYAEELQRYEDSLARLEAANARYRAMIVEVDAWTPPTGEHQGLKDFMRDQLTKSIHDWQPKKPEKLPLPLWKQARRERLEHDIEYYAKEAREEESRTRDRNVWVAALRDSLKPKIPA